MKFLVLLYKEFLQFIRNRGLLLFTVYAFTLDIYLAATGIDLTLKNASFYAQDRDYSFLSRELISKFPPYYFNFKGYLMDDDQIDEVLLDDRAIGVIEIPQKFEKNIKEGKRLEVGVLVNGAEISSSYLFSAYAEQIIYSFLTGNFLRGGSWIEVRPRIFFNQNASSKVFMAYSELLTVITLFLLLLPAAAIVIEKERGNIEMLLVSPVPIEFFTIVKVIAMSVLVLIFTALALFFTVERLSGVPFHGREVDFLILTAAYAFTTTGLSLFIASISENMLQVSQLTILIMVPILYLSGSWTPIESMPKVLQWLSVLSPLKYYINGALSIAIKGRSLWELRDQILALLILGGTLFTAGTFFLKKKS